MENATDPRAQFGLDAIGPALDADGHASYLTIADQDTAWKD